MPLVKWLDVPPVWLAAFLFLAWRLSFLMPGLGFPGPIFDLLAGFLVGGGVLLMGLAVQQMRRHKTTVNPHGESAALVQTGVFKRSRNPIYLGDTLLLAGLILWWDAVLALPLVPIFLWVIERRFVLPEEDRLRRMFRKQYAAYCNKVRRWV